MRIGLLITARLKSTRLPLKLLLDLQGKPLIARVIERAKLVKEIDAIVLCTSHNEQDKPLIDIAKDNDIDFFLGSEEDVLQRLRDAAKKFNLDYIISITGENPIFSIEHANLVVDELTKFEYDFVSLKGLPIGTAVYGIRALALEIVCQTKKVIDTEIWGPLINRPEIFKVKDIEVDAFFRRPSLRITTDYPEDFEFISKIFSHFDEEAIPRLSDVLNILDKNIEYLLINKTRKQKELSPEVIDKIDTYYEKNRDRIIQLKEQIYQN